MAASPDELRTELRELEARRARGDVRQRDYDRRRTDGSVALSRAVVGARLATDEPILAEHHLVHSHFKLTQSMLQEPEQATVSFFATDRRLLRMRSRLATGRAVSCDEVDDTMIDELPYAALAAIERRHERRWGEVAVGGTAAVLAFLLGGLLAVTGPFLVVVGLAGMTHGLLLPTRWVVLTADPAPDPPFIVHGVRRKSARALLAVLRRALAAPDRRLSPPASGLAP
jgi:hypothetical protein